MLLLVFLDLFFGRLGADRRRDKDPDKERGEKDTREKGKVVHLKAEKYINDKEQWEENKEQRQKEPPG